MWFNFVFIIYFIRSHDFYALYNNFEERASTRKKETKREQRETSLANIQR